MNKEDLTIEAVLDYYSEEVVDTLAFAVVTTDKFPEEALNELRASYTHLARAHKHADDPDLVQEELNSAKRHLKRVCVDSLKLSAMAVAQRVDSAVEALTEDHQLPNNVYQQVSALQQRRKAISVHESRETTLGVIEEMKELVNDYDAFWQSLDNEFAGASATTRAKARRRKELKSGVIGFGLGIVASLISAGIYDAATSQSDTAPLSTDRN